MFIFGNDRDKLIYVGFVFIVVRLFKFIVIVLYVIDFVGVFFKKCIFVIRVFVVMVSCWFLGIVVIV